MCEPSDRPSPRPELNDAIDQELVDWLFRLCYRLTGNVHDAENLTQDVLTQMVRKWETYRPGPDADPGGALKRWVAAIARNHHIAQQRKRRVKTRPILEETDSAGDSTPADRGGPSLDEMVRHEDRERLKTAIDALPETLREAILLRYGKGLKDREIADALGIPEGTVARRLHDARSRLAGAFPEMRPATV